jgi:hypothetical protein
MSTNCRNVIVLVSALAGCLWSGAALAQQVPQQDARLKVASPADLGIVASFDGGPSLPVAADSGLELGYHLGGTVGLEVRPGRPGSRFSVTPEVMASYTSWPVAGLSVLRDVSQSMWTIQAGGKLAYYLGPVGLWASLRAGYGQIGLDVMGLSKSEGGLAVSGGLGATIMITRYLGLGPYAELNKTIADVVGGRQLGAGELDFGLRLKAKLPL